MEERTLVQFHCKVDGNPAPELSLWLRDISGNEEQAANDIVTDLELSVNIILTRYHHGKQVYCKAVNTELEYIIYSNPLEYEIQCMVHFFHITSTIY